MKKRNLLPVLGLAAALLLTACGGSGNSGSASSEANVDDEGNTIVTVGVVGEYNAHWDTVNEVLAPEKIQVELVKFSDYATPNRALNDGEIDLNSFQHKAFLKNDVETAGYEITDIGDTLIAPLSIYNNKDKIQSVDDIKDGDIIAIPSDRTNGGRALKLLEAAGLIVCDPEAGSMPTVADITTYNKQIDIKEAESATLANLLPDCTAAVINGGNAFTAGLNPTEDSIFTEDVDPKTNPGVADLINVIAARTADKDNETYKKVVDAFHTDKVRQSIIDNYDGAFIPAF